MKKVILAAGGTGGHINAALSIGEELKTQGYEVVYFTGKRHLDYKLLEKQETIHIDAKPLRTKNPIKLTINILLNLKTFMQVFLKVININPSFVIGCGGYVCGPTLLTSWLAFKKVYVVEQNAIAGLTNKLLSNIADLNFISFKNTKGITKNTYVSGNPIRSNINYKEIVKKSDDIKILVFGGSLGARQINESIAFLIKKLNEKFIVRHQVGKGNLTNSSSPSYEEIEYLDNIQKDYEWADIIISRAGASSVSELEMVQKPVIFIPYPAAVDNHQEYNARALKEKVKFHVSIVNQSKYGEELADELFNEINNIIECNKFTPTEVVTPPSATRIIIEEIQKQCMA